jgi:glycerol-3-phosphate dehydrogenase
MPTTEGATEGLAFSARTRAAILSGFARQPLDLLVIGGGINGAAIAREAALRGIRVGLVDKGDFASGTSSRSSKLIHGGLRYLELGDLRLVFAACQERDLLRRRLAPHLVVPLPFVFPVYEGDPRGLLAIKAGLWLYDLLATLRNIRRHRMLTPRSVLAREPRLRREGLRGAGFYYDCWTDDARLTLETVLSARGEGAQVCNYVEVAGFLYAGERIAGARLRDVLDGTEIEVRAAVVVSAAGPWVDAIRRLDDPGCTPVLRLTKGVHVVVPRGRVGNRNALAVRSPSDGRVMFVLPWGDHALVGTTDTDHHGGPDAVEAAGGDVDYLLEAVNHYFPAAALGRSDVVSAFAGLRALVVSGENSGGLPSSLSREEMVVVSRTGLISLAGGKLTTHRRAAIVVVRHVVAELRRRGDRRPFPKSRSHRRPLVGAVAGGGPARHPHDGGATADDHLRSRYGRRLADVLALLDGPGPQRQRLLPALRDLRGEVGVAVASEMAVRVEDVLRRRLSVTLRDPEQGLGVAAEVAAMMANELGWDDVRRREEEAAYAVAVARQRRAWVER